MSVALNILKVLIAMQQQQPLQQELIELATRLMQQLSHESLDEQQQDKFFEYQKVLRIA